GGANSAGKPPENAFGAQGLLILVLTLKRKFFRQAPAIADFAKLTRATDAAEFVLRGGKHRIHPGADRIEALPAVEVGSLDLGVGDEQWARQDLLIRCKSKEALTRHTAPGCKCADCRDHVDRDVRRDIDEMFVRDGQFDDGPQESLMQGRADGGSLALLHARDRREADEGDFPTQAQLKNIPDAADVLL